MGWLKVDYNVAGEPALPIEDGYYLYKFPASGQIKTSSGNEYGWATDQYFYYSGVKRTQIESNGSGNGGMIWGGSNGWSGSTYEDRTATYEHFFVGPEELFRKYADLRNEDGQPWVVNLNSSNPPPPPRPPDLIPK